MIKAEDIARLDAELNPGTNTDEWLRKNDIDFDAIEMICWSAFEALTEKTREGVELRQALAETIANSFALGWEAFRQYGERKA